MGHRRFAKPLPCYAEVGREASSEAFEKELKEMEHAAPDLTIREAPTLEPVPEQAPAEAPPSPPALPVEEPPGTTVEAPIAAAPSVLETPVPVSVEAPPPTETVESYKAHIEELKRAILDLSGDKPVEAPTAPVSEQPVAQPQAQAPPSAGPQEMVRFVDDSTLQEVVTDPDKFNAVLNTALNTVLRVLPHVVAPMMQQMMILDSQVRDFWKSNEDLMPMKAFVKTTADSLQAKNPTWSTEQVLKETSKRVREVFRAGIQGATANSQMPPVIVPTPAPLITTVRPPKPELSDFDKQLRAMEEVRS